MKSRVFRHFYPATARLTATFDAHQPKRHPPCFKYLSILKAFFDSTTALSRRCAHLAKYPAILLAFLPVHRLWLGAPHWRGYPTMKALAGVSIPDEFALEFCAPAVLV